MKPGSKNIKLQEDYRRYVAKRAGFIICLITLVILTFFYALNIGSFSFSFKTIFKALSGERSKVALVLWNIRLPRIMGALFVGAGLAVSGCVMQCILRNPLASPFTMGISHGAVFGASLAIGTLGAGSVESTGKIFINNPYIVVIFAFSGSLFGMLVVLTLAKLKGLGPGAMVLAGVAMGSLFTAATTLIQYFATEQQLAAMVYWSFGDLGRVIWREIWIIAGIFLFCFVYFFLKRWDYNAMESGDEVAKSLGVKVERVRLTGALFASLITGVAVSLVGIIGFIGLICPHLIRLLIGGDHRFLIPASAIFGALLLLTSDSLARTVVAPVILPVGVLTSFMGAPMFIFLLIKAKGEI
ncbi:MAG TPA: iron ABC transporter permease [Candidatus Aerophobetes bacterium]|uniref:Iron ABC transporter permease n=1 Tax=Aerophobetes bacterium TaxID=2030807 RepID=A0A7V5I268_UNCAE|nr:iron ABC transporter permease [Candidatus Aerophobetes bacterium]